MYCRTETEPDIGTGLEFIFPAGVEDDGDGALALDRRRALKFLGVNMAALGLGGAMALIVVAVFMQLHRTPALARLFAYAGVLWLGILFGLMSLDYVYR